MEESSGFLYFNNTAMPLSKFAYGRVLTESFHSAFVSSVRQIDRLI